MKLPGGRNSLHREGAGRGRFSEGHAQGKFTRFNGILVPHPQAGELLHRLTPKPVGIAQVHHGDLTALGLVAFEGFVHFFGPGALLPGGAGRGSKN